ncbi:MAG: SMP-30/gluconolactonase/LRE family protein [Chthoniobacteraceae bacterium]
MISRFLPLLLLATSVAAEPPISPALPATILPKDAKVELLQSGFKFTEGAALAPDGRIFFNDIPNNRTHVYNPATGEITVHREDTGAANGLKFDATGALLSCEGANRMVTRQPAAADLETIAREYEGKKLNSPNDLDLDAKGGIYFTDPRYGKTDDLEQPCEGVYYLPPGGGKLLRVVDSLKKPNGLAISKDQRVLYVADNALGSVHAFDINPADGTVSNGRVLTAEAPVNDGMTVDKNGNLYVTTKEGVKVFNTEGKHLGTIIVPEVPCNCAFGAKGSKTLYITAQTGFYKIQTAVDGLK